MADGTDDPRVGSVIAGYRIDERIGRGGMGDIYRATDTTLGRAVAIKVLAEHLALDANFRARFLREARAAAAIPHPAVVRMIHVDVSDEGLLYQVQELIDGTTLEKALAAAPLSPGEAARVGEVLRIQLRYTEDRKSVISGLERVSKPGRRTYVNSKEIPKVLGGMGTTIVSTSSGVMTGHDARRQGVGGEVLAYVW